MKTAKKFVPLIMTLVVFVFFYYSVDFDQMLLIFKSFSISTLIGAIILYGLSYLARAVRFKILLGDKFSLALLLPIVYIHGFYNRVLPARTGELSFVYLMRKNDVDIEQSILTLLYARIYDFLTMIFLVIATFPFIYFRSDKVGLIFILGGVILLILLIMFYLPTMLKGIYRISVKLCTTEVRFWAKIKQSMEQVIKYSELLSSKALLLKVISISIINWLLIFSMFFILLKEFGINLGFFQVMFGSSFANLTNVLPLSAVGGFGTMEAGWTFGFTLIGLDYKTAITTGLAINIFAFITISIFGLLGLGYITLFKESNKWIKTSKGKK